MKRTFKTLPLQLTPEQLEKVKAEAQRTSLTMSAVLRILIDCHLGK